MRFKFLATALVATIALLPSANLNYRQMTVKHVAPIVSVDQAYRHYNEILRKLLVAAGKPSDYVRLEFDKDYNMNAYAHYSTLGSERLITVTYGLISKGLSDGEIAELLGHELSHHLLGHLDDSLGPIDRYTPVYITVESQRRERDADLHGQKLAVIAGYGACGAVDLMNLLIANSSQPEIAVDHPADYARVAYLNKMCKVVGY